MKQKNFTLSLHSAKSASHGGWAGYLNKLVALVLLVGGLGASRVAVAQQFFDNAVVITQQPTGASSSMVPYAGKRADAPYNTYTRLGNSTANPVVDSPQLGTYDLNGNSQLQISGGSLIVAAPGRGTSYTGAQLEYRVYLTGTAAPAYTPIALTAAGTDSFGDLIYRNDNTTVDLLKPLVNGNNYTIDIRFALIVNDGTSTTTVTDPSNSSYSLVFYVTPPPVTPTGGTTTWQSTTSTGGSTDWLLASNWSNGVPTATSNAIIPAKTNSAIVYPILNSATAPYAVKNLTLQGTTGSSAAQLTIGVATLRVYGNISQPAGGLTGNTTNNAGVADPNSNSTIILAGADQVITGQLLVSDVIVAGSGIKSVINTIIPANIIAFRPADVAQGVIIQSASQDNSNSTISTVFDTTGNSYITLVSSSTISLVVGDAETNTSYIKGVTRADRQLAIGVQNKFGNIGLDLTANHSPGNIFVYRVVGDPLTGPLAAGAVPTKRYFQIKGDDDSSKPSTAGSNLNVIFHYLNSTDELNGIKEENLIMFSAQQNGAPFRGTANSTLIELDKTVTTIGLPSTPNFYLTLGDKTNPLPVSLVAFAAVRNGANTLLSWTTASEQNNKGFNVQVSADGVTYRTLAFVASKSPNSSNELSYKYIDVEAGKAGTRYYRLEQVDEDGKLNYSPVRAVGFDGAAATSVALVAYPNPFSDTIGLTVEGATTTDGTAYVKLVDMTGRTVLDQKLSLNGASLTLGDVSGLRSGLYLAKVTLPDGTVQTVRVQKQ